MVQGALFAIALTALLFIAPLYLNAQSDISLRGDMSATIKNALLTDPRAQSLSPEELDAISFTLTRQAQAQGMTQHDLLWRPALAHTITANEITGAGNTCGNVPLFICGVNQSIGLSGSDMTIVILLGVLVVLILATTAGYLELRHRNKLRMQVQA